MSSWDAIVIGLGGVGSAAAFHLAESGLRVLGFDQYPPVHAYGSSHGRTRIIRQAYFEHPSYVPLLRRAYELWDELESRTGKTLFHRTGLVEMGPADGIVIPGVLRSAAEHHLEVEEIDPLEVSRRWPGLFAEPDWSVVIECNAGYLAVEACVAAHLERARAASATLRHGHTVRAWRAVNGHVEVTTDHGIESAKRLIIAGGGWSGRLLQDLGLPLTVLRKHQYWFEQDPRLGPPQTYTQEEGFPCFFHETASGFYYGFPSKDSAGIKVARHSGGEVIAAPTAVHSADARDRSLVQNYVRQYLPKLGNRLIAQAGCYYTCTPDEHFILDRHPDASQVIVVAGLSGHGFKFTSVLGELASKMARDDPMSLDTTLLGIQR